MHPHLLLIVLTLLGASVNASPTRHDGKKARGTTPSLNPRQLIPFIDWNPQYADGHACNRDAECKSGFCRGKQCSSDATCQVDTDCNYSDLICNSKQECTYGYKFPGAACTDNRECRTGSCDGKCTDRTGYLSGPCNSDGFCDAGYTCRYVQFVSPDAQICWPGQAQNGTYGTQCRSDSDCGVGLDCQGKKESYCFRGMCTQEKPGVCREKSQKCTAEGDACLTDSACCKDLTCKISEILFISTCQ